MFKKLLKVLGVFTAIGSLVLAGYSVYCYFANREPFDFVKEL